MSREGPRLAVSAGRRVCRHVGAVAGLGLIPVADAAAAAGLKGPAAPWTSMAGLGVALLAGALAASVILSPVLRRVLFPVPRESHIADVLQFDGMLDDGVTLRTKDGRLVQTLVLRGMDYGAKTDAEISALLRKRQQWFQSLSEVGQAVKLLSVRERVAFDGGAAFEEPMLQEIHDSWMKSFEAVYQNRHYVVVSTQNDRKARKRLRELVRAVSEQLHEYGPELLEVGHGDHSPLLSMWASAVSGFHRSVRPARGDLSERLAGSDVHFDPVTGIIEYRDGPRVRYCQVLTVNHWGEADGPELIHRIMSLQGRVQVLQSIFGVRKERAAVELPLRAKQAAILAFNRFKGAEFEAALELVNGDQDGLLTVQISMFLLGDSLEDLEQLVSETRRIVQDHGASAVVEGASAEWTWRSRLPGFAEDARFLVRPRTLMGENLASLVSFQEEPAGSESSDWGDGPIRVFRTVTGGAYSFQFHVSEAEEAIGHTVTFAPSGGGKTVLFSHLMGGALRHRDLACYAFDRNGGLRIFTEAVGGRYIDPAVDADVELNPLQMPDTTENRRFLQLWLLRLAGISDEDSSSYESASRAVEAIYNVRRTHARSLRTVFESAFDTGSMLREGLQRWVNPDDYGARVFNGAKDSLNLEASRLVTFEMAAALGGSGTSDPRLAGALVSYIMHRIRARCRAEGTPHLVFVDETAALLADDAFKRDTEVMLREHRKLRGSVNLVFQDVGVMLNSGIGETVLNNCPTHFVFPNPNARKEDYAVLELTDSQWAYVKGQSRLARHLPRSVLLKRGSEAVILDTDLGPLGPLLKIYRSGSEPVRLVETLKRQVGERWLETYIDSAA